MSRPQQPDTQDRPATERSVDGDPAPPTPAERISRALGTAPVDADRSTEA